MPDVTYREANRRYRKWFTPVMLVYVLLCFLGPTLMAFAGGPDGAPKWAMAIIAVITGAPIAGVFWLVGRYLKETDEYTRALQVNAMLTGGAIVLSLAVIWSFLELYQVAPRLQYFPSMMLIGPGFFLFYGMTYLVQHLRRGGRSGDMPGPGRDEP